ncbi:hydantoin racemase [Nakamurella sp. YIM 132087]|uniref:Hydantoin racemase n=1 Tax=Nakamurella alba TaxID=2665158 RepID=A0A7K1FRA3_9ACTN|nr:aspartate/glutamate racemase family protein [Nakamurella alba]MTD15773.1 hydantoin racemase [Nakamurella alba]
MTGPLRLRVIAPVRLPDEAIGARQARYRELAGPGLQVDLDPLTGPDAPRALDDAAAVEASIACVRAQAEAVTPDVADIVLPDCVLDPGVIPGAASQVPVLGILQLVGSHLAALQQPFTAVTRNRPIADELHRKAGEYGFGHLLLETDVIDGGIELISDEPEWVRRLSAVAVRRAAEGIGTVFNGCSAVAVPPGLAAGVAVIDPTALALQLLSLSRSTGLLPVVHPAAQPVPA